MDEFRSVNEKLAIDLMGLPYVKIPRYTLDLLKCPATRQLGQLHLLLFDICFFADGYTDLNGRKVPCKRGEYVGTQQELADLSGINIGSINRLIRKLEALHLISVTKIQGGSLIKVHGYTGRGMEDNLTIIFTETERFYSSRMDRTNENYFVSSLGKIKKYISLRNKI